MKLRDFLNLPLSTLVDALKRDKLISTSSTPTGPSNTGSIASLDDVPDSTTRKAMLGSERTKLTNLPANATANITDIASAALMDSKDADILSAIKGGVAVGGDNLAKLYALIQTLNSIVTNTTPDGDTVTNTIQEILAIFASYPEGVDIVNTLGGKVNTTAVVNTLTEIGTGKVLDARQGKILKDLIDTLFNNITPLQLYVDDTTISGDGTLENPLSAKSNLTPTAIKASPYTAAANELVKTDATSATVPITLPTGQPDKTRIAVKMVAVSGAFTTTIAAGGSAVFNKAGGSTSVSLTLLNQAVTFQYESTGSIWSALSSDVPLSQLDLRYPQATIATDAQVANTINLSAWGDSLTQGVGGISWLGYFSGMAGFQVYNGGVGGETSTQIKARFDAATDKLGYSTVFWVGRNDWNAGSSYSTYATTIKANLAAMVAALGHNRYVVVGITNNSSSEGTGTAALAAMKTLNSELATLYGTHFFDVYSYLLTQGTGTGQDATDVTNEIVPASLRYDALHYNFKAYAKIASKIAEKVSILTDTSARAVTPANLIAELLAQRSEVQLKYGGRVTIGGFQALYIPTQEDANGNNSIGVGTGGKTVTGTGNTWAGMKAFDAATSAASCSVFGCNAGNLITTATQVTAMGQHALSKVATNGSGTAVGYASLFNATGGFNTAFGAGSGQAVSTGTGNVMIGFQAGDNVTTGGTNVIVGNNIDAPSATASGQLVIANVIFGQGCTGNSLTKAGTIGIGTSALTTSQLALPGGTTTISSLNIASGVAPTTPVNGDIWSDGTNMFIRLGGVTKTFTIA